MQAASPRGSTSIRLAGSAVPMTPGCCRRSPMRCGTRSASTCTTGAPRARSSAGCRPLGLVLKAGVWYLVAQVGDQPRTYRVSNIIDLAVTEESFKRPKDFDLSRFWVTSSRAFETSVYHSNATLRVTARGLAKLDVLGSAVARAAAETATPPDADGWVSVTIPIESVERAASGLIALGADAEVVEP